MFVIPPYIKFDNFVNPAFNERIVVKKSGNYGSVLTEIPMGAISLSAYLKKNTQVDIKLLDFNIVLNKIENFNYNSFSELFLDVISSKEWVDYAPTIIGISALFAPAYYNMLDIASAARKVFSSSLIIAGGGVPTNMYKEIFRVSAYFDAICYGEGEKPLLKLVNADNKKELLQNNLSWITRDKIEDKQQFKYDFVENLDEIPFFDFGILNVNDYYSNSLLSLFPLEKERNRKGMPIMTSRGCPHRCIFCASHAVHGRVVRYYSLKRVKEDLTRLRDEYGAETAVFFDDHLMADRQRVFDIVSILNNLKLTTFFPSSLALYALDKKMLAALKSTGMDNLVLSVESGSDRVLRDIMHKPLNLSIVQRVLHDCRELGIASDVSILIGLPGETKQDIDDALSFLKTLNATWFRISMATPLVGSEMLDICLKNNYIKGDYMSCDFKRAIIETGDFTAEYIQEKAYTMNLELNFVLNNEVKLGNYSTALRGFENTIEARDDHAFAYYFAAKCYKMMDQIGKYGEYKSKYDKIIEKSEFWKKYADQFQLPALE